MSLYEQIANQDERLSGLGMLVIKMALHLNIFFSQLLFSVFLFFGFT